MVFLQNQLLLWRWMGFFVFLGGKFGIIFRFGFVGVACIEWE